MSDSEAETFDIVFRGDIVLGQPMAEVKARLQQLFKADAAKVDSLFSGRPVVLKRNLDRASADKYRQVLVKAGAQVEVCPAGSVKTGAPAKPRRQAPPVPAVEPAAEAPQTAKPQPETGWSLAPAGDMLLKPAERRRVDPVQVDIGKFTLRPAQGNLLDAEEVDRPAPAQVTVPGYDLAPEGEDLLKDSEKRTQPMAAVTAGDWDLAEVGSDLLSKDERTPAPPPSVDVGDWEIAPAGSDLGQKKAKPPPPPPDTGNLSLSDSD